MTLNELLKSMDIPEFRRDITKKENVLWLLRNLGIRNSNHENYSEAMSLLKKLSRY